MLGAEEVVFKFFPPPSEGGEGGGCAGDLEGDFTDTPARAFRDGSNNVILMAGHHSGNRRMTGPTLGSVQRVCDPLKPLDSHYDANWTAFNGYEWLHSFYTNDGIIVHALIHNEHHGWLYEPILSSGACKGVHYDQCWYNAITSATSFNGGYTFQHSIQPLLIARATTIYVDELGPNGFFNPSNIIKEDGYYYAILHTEKSAEQPPLQPSQPSGACVMRTATIDVPSSWRGWNGNCFCANLATEPCTVASQPYIDRMSDSLTRSSHLNGIVLVGMMGQDISYSTSSDPSLIAWAPAKPMLPTTDSFPSGHGIAYPVLLDEAPSPAGDTTRYRNFEITGKRPYLYFTRFHPSSIRELVRIPIEFDGIGTFSTLPLFRVYQQNGNHDVQFPRYSPAGTLEPRLCRLEVSGGAGLRPLYNCRNSVDTFVSTDSNCEGFEVVYPGPIGYAYDANAAGRATLYRCRRAWNGGWDHFLSIQSDCEGTIQEGPIGYCQL